MTTQTVSSRWRRTVTGAAAGALAAGLMAGFGAPQAFASPDTTTPASPSATADSGAVPVGDVIAYLDEEYDTGAGGGQLSNLVRAVLKLQAQGFKPSRSNLADIQDALDDRPNQKPLIAALQETVAYQSKIKAQTALLQQAQAAQNANNAVMGAGQMPSDGNPFAGGGQPAQQPAP